MDIEIIKCTHENTDFGRLTDMLDKELSIRDGEEHAFYSQFNFIDTLSHCVVLKVDGTPASCGALKPFEDNAMEVKRMFTHPDFRGKGLATSVLAELEKWAKEEGKERCVLETGKNLPEAISLYQNRGYVAIPKYGQYVGVEGSVCFGKEF